MDRILQDGKSAWRSLRQSPGFVVSAVCTIALAIGANTAVFSLVEQTLLRPLPYVNPERLLQIWLVSPPDGRTRTLSVPEFHSLSGETALFSDLAAYDFGGPGVSLSQGNGEAEEVRAIHVSQGYFRLFGARLARGRAFTVAEAKPGGGRVVVLTDALWRRSFGADPLIAGRTARLGGEPHLVLGVLEPGFVSDPPADLYLPLQAEPASTSHAHYLRIGARLRDGVTLTEANARLKITTQEFKRMYPAFRPSFEASSFVDSKDVDLRAALLLLWAAVGAVLLIACVNVANLMLARATVREQEWAVRAALGAGRGRLLTQSLAESLILALGGVAAGVPLGLISLRAASRWNEDIALDAVTLNGWMLGFAVLAAGAVTMLCGWIPAWQSSGVRLGAGSRASASRQTVRLKSVLIAAEAGLVFMLLIQAGLMVKSFAALRRANSGVQAEGVLTLYMPLQGSKWSDTAAVARLTETGVERLQRTPGVIAAATTWTLPLENAFSSTYVIEGRPLGKDPAHGLTLMRPVSARFAEVFGLRRIAGRFLNERDTATAPRVAVISEAFAKKHFPRQNPVGERLRVDANIWPAGAYQIVGVMGDVRDEGMSENPEPMVYLPQTQIPDGMTKTDISILPFTWVVRTAGEPYRLTETIRSELRAASGGLAVGRVRSMVDVIRASTARSDFQTSALAGFAMVTLLLAAVGVYGVIAFNVAQRRREIGVRLALGSTEYGVIRLVLWETGRWALAGMTVGLVASVALGRSIESFLYGVKPADLMVTAVSASLLAAVTVMSALVPARRAARLDPAAVIRE